MWVQKVKQLLEADQSAVLSDFNELKQEVMQMKADIETKEMEQDSKLLRLVEQRHIDVQAREERQRQHGHLLPQLQSFPPRSFS